MNGDRAVSEVLGFVFVASLILATIGVVYVAGMGGLTDARNAERVQNAERAFDVLADNLEDQRARGAPSRATEIKLADAQLSYGTPTTFLVKVTNTATGNIVTSASKTVDPIVYSTGRDTQIVYDSGAIMRIEKNGGRLKNPPSFVFLQSGGQNTAVIPILQTRQTGPASVGGTTTVLVRSETSVRQVLISERDASYQMNLTLETTPARASVWVDYLNRPETIPYASSPCSRTGGRVTCLLSVDRVTVTRTGIDVRFA